MKNHRSRCYIPLIKHPLVCMLAALVGCLSSMTVYAQNAGSSADLQRQLSHISDRQRSSVHPSITSAQPQAQASQRPVVNAQQPPQTASSSPATRSNDAPPTVAGTAGATGSTVGQDAFAATIRTMMPMTPEQIRTLRLAYDTAHKASVFSAGTPPTPVAASRGVDLSPGATPPVVRLATGYITSLVMVDATGEPWPIKAFDLGNPAAYNIQWDKKGNTLMIQATTGFKPANLAVLLQGLNTPIMITLLPGQQAVDYRVDMRIPRMGPNARQQTVQLPQATDPMLLNVLDGIKPARSRALAVVGGEAQAWLGQNQVYMRTPLTVVSPGWVSMVSSADGTHVYVLPKASMVLAIDRGKMVQLQLKGF